MSDSTRGERPDHPLERLIFFSDAVIAIAITLLVVELHPEHLPWSAPIREYLIWLLIQLPSITAFFISFFVIGAFWGGHHRAFALAGHYSETLNFPNLLFLCAIAFMPFPTAWMGQNMGATVPTVVYDLTLLVTGILNMRLIAMVTRPPVVAEGIDSERLTLVRARGPAVVLASLLALIVAFLFAPVSQLMLITIPFWRRWLQRRALARLYKEQAAQAAG